MSLCSQRLLFLIILLSLVPALSGVRPAQAVTPTPRPSPTAPPTPSRPQTAQEQRLAAGRQVYLQNYCGICHTLAAAGTNGTFGPPHDGIATIARQRLADPAYSGQAVTVVQYLRESIVQPAAYAAPGYAYTSHPMPPYGHLAKRDLDALIYFLLQQK